MLTDISRPIIHRFSKFLIPSSKSKLDHHTKIPKSAIRYDMGQSGVGLGIFAALERCGSAAAGSGKSANTQSAITRVYCDEKVMGKRAGNGDQMIMKKMKCCIFNLRVEEDFEAFPGPEFLSCCNLCRKELCGKDIYMYRGEKAFCSEECREVQIAEDERKDGCTSYAVFRYVDVGARNSCPVSSRDRQMQSTGIFAI